MIGLLKKDFLLILRSSASFYGILFLLFIFLSISEGIQITFLIPYISIAAMITTFNYDAYNKWNSYVVSIPYGRKNAVKAKYLTTLLLIFLTTFFSAFLSILLSYFAEETIPYQDIITNACIHLFTTILLFSFLYPLIFKLDIEKARIGVFILVFILICFGNFLSQVFTNSMKQELFSILNAHWQLFYVLFLLFLLQISYKISQVIYQKREF